MPNFSDQYSIDFSGRNQFVQIDEKQSDTREVHFGVPQGSILGPVLFNLYVNNLQNILDCPSLVNTRMTLQSTIIAYHKNLLTPYTR